MLNIFLGGGVSRKCHCVSTTWTSGTVWLVSQLVAFLLAVPVNVSERWGTTDVFLLSRRYPSPRRETSGGRACQANFTSSLYSPATIEEFNET